MLVTASLNMRQWLCRVACESHLSGMARKDLIVYDAREDLEGVWHGGCGGFISAWNSG